MTTKLCGSLLLATFTFLGSACGQPGDAVTEGDESLAFASQSLTASAALLVVGNTTLVAGDAALQNRLLGLGFAVTIRTGSAVSAADVSGKVVVISESVTSAEVNTKLRNVAVPVVALEPALFDDLGFVDAVATNYGTATSQSSLLMLGAPGAPTGDVTVAVTSSPQTFAWGKPVASAVRIATVAGDASRSTIFSFEKGSLLSGSTAAARRAGWFATAGAPVAFNSNAWSLFDGLMRWARAGLSAVCASDSDCPGSTCVAGSCATTCGAGFASCAGACVDLATSSNNCGSCGKTCTGTSCVAGACSTSCAGGFSSCSGACVDLTTSSSNCGSCGKTCSAGQLCQSGACL